MVRRWFEVNGVVSRYHLHRDHVNEEFKLTHAVWYGVGSVPNAVVSTAPLVTQAV